MKLYLITSIFLFGFLLNGTSQTTVTTPQQLLSAISSASPGDIIYVVEGTYTFGSRFSISRNGTDGNMISLLPHPNNTSRPFLDFSSMSENSSNRAISLSGQYWHIKGLDVFGAGDNGLFISGSNNLIEFCTFSECKDSGLQIGNGGSNNTVLNCDSYFNADSTLENADGFACKLDAGTDNKFIGCRAWQNLDDGWDGYLRGADNITTTYEDCWAIKNGYLKDGSVGAGDGNGFKTGGSDDKLLSHHAIYTNCIAAGNVFDGFDHNSNRGDVEIYNSGALSNGRNISFGSGNIANSLVIKNTVSIDSDNDNSYNATTTDISNNSWQNGLGADSNDYLSLNMDLLLAPRKEDGSLPDVDFMRLVAGSDLIDAGIDVGLEFTGSAPDIGPFEYSTLSIKDLELVEGLSNYPNPFSDQTTILFNLLQPMSMQVSLYSMLGHRVEYIQKKSYNVGRNTIVLERNKLSSGSYLLVLKSDQGQTETHQIAIK